MRQARPLGSTARYCPGITRLTPDFPNVSKWMRLNLFCDGTYSMMVIRPESDPIMMQSFQRFDASDRGTSDNSGWFPGASRITKMTLLGKNRAQRTFVASGQPESRKRSYDAKDILRVYRSYFALSGVRTMKCKLRTGSGHNLLLFCTRELSEYSLRYSCGVLQRQGIHEHIRCSRHGGQLLCSGRAVN